MTLEADGPTWDGPALLVPVQVEALPVTDGTYLDAWCWSPPGYGALGTLGRVDAVPFTPAPIRVPGTQKFRGVIVSWALPDGLTRGTQSGPGVLYPAIPNRWLVVRRAPVRGSWTTAAWVVASDYVGGAQGSPWPDPEGRRATRLGMSWPVDQWPGEAAAAAAAASPPLTATGAGDPTFGAFVPNVLDVLAFADPLDGVGQGPVSYTVLGWYGDLERDPLRGVGTYGTDGWQTRAEWEALMTGLGWSAGDEHDLDDAVVAAHAWALAHGEEPDPHRPRDRFPSRTLCHGSVQEVAWSGPSGPPVSGVPTSNPQLPSYVRPQVALANAGVDALAALLGEAERAAGMDDADVARLVEILQAFVHQDLAVLDEPDGLVRLGVEVQGAWFGSIPGGTTYAVVGARDPASPGGHDIGLPAEAAAALGELNRIQARLDAATSALASAQAARYDLWWKGGRLPFVPGVTRSQKDAWQALIDTATPLADAAVEAQSGAYRWLLRQRDQALVALQGQLEGHTLVADAAAPYARPNDPVLLVTGAGRVQRHGEDGRFAPDGQLRVRFTGQAVAGLEVATPGGSRAASVTVTGADLPPPVLPWTGLPVESPDLLVEGFFLDPATAPAIASVAAGTAGLADPWSLLSAVRAGQAVAWNAALHAGLDAQAIAAAAGLVFQEGRGAMPSKVAVQLWAPPWAPLYLDWAVDFVPGTADQAGVLAPWELPADDGPDPLDDLTYRWTGSTPPTGDPLGVQGRTLLTPQATEVLAARIEKAVDELADDPHLRPDLWALQDTLTYLREADVLGQSLSGFGDALLERDPSTFPLPSDPASRSWLAPPGVPPSSPAATPWPAAGVDPVRFNPVRAGHVRLRRLWVVDAFGQVLKVIDPSGGSLPAATPPLLGPDLTTSGDPGQAELKPRLLQPARLRIDLLAADDDLRRVDLDPDARPVCGWLLSNHLDRSLLVYEADGTLAGEVLRTPDRATWSPAPDRFAPPEAGAAPVDIADGHLRSIVTGLLARSDSGTALDALLGLVDTATSSALPASGWADDELPVLVGRPLAVVRARLVLEACGAPATVQDWPATGSTDTAGSTGVRFDVQLGIADLLADGVVGYFVDDAYDAIDSVHRLTAPHDYVRGGRPSVALDDPGGALLTLVLDPACAVHAVSGILPVVTTTVPGPLWAPALRALAVTFRVGPVVDSPGVATMPLPALQAGAWSWLQYDDEPRPARSWPVGAADATAALPDPAPVLREGWLRLVLGGPATTLTYAVSPTTVSATTDATSAATATLQVSVYNGSGADVACEQITVALPVGHGADDLTADVSTLAARPLPRTDWTVDVDTTGTVTARPVAAGAVVAAGATIGFQIAGIRVGAVPGIATITVTETTDAARRTQLHAATVAPGPATLLTYTAAPTAVACGSTASVVVTGYNATTATLRPTRLLVAVPVGTGPGDLVPDAAGVTVTATGWETAVTGPGTWALRPADAPVDLGPGASLQVTVAGLHVGATPGAALVQVTETAAAADATGEPTTAVAPLLVTATSAGGTP